MYNSKVILPDQGPVELRRPAQRRRTSFRVSRAIQLRYLLRCIMRLSYICTQQLRCYLTERGKIFSRNNRRNLLTAKQQRQMARVVKQTRHLGFAYSKKNQLRTTPVLKAPRRYMRYVFRRDVKKYIREEPTFRLGDCIPRHVQTMIGVREESLDPTRQKPYERFFTRKKAGRDGRRRR